MVLKNQTAPTPLQVAYMVGGILITSAFFQNLVEYAVPWAVGKGSRPSAHPGRRPGRRGVWGGKDLEASEPYTGLPEDLPKVELSRMDSVASGVAEVRDFRAYREPKIEIRFEITSGESGPSFVFALAGRAAWLAGRDGCLRHTPPGVLPRGSLPLHS